MIESKYAFIWIVIGVFFLASCASVKATPTPSAEEILHSLGVENSNDFETLSSCEQVKTYAIVGSRNLDIEHGVAVVPQWMNDTISRQSHDDIAVCIAEQGEMLLKEWEDVYDSANLNLSYQILALVYKADDLDVVRNSLVQRFIMNAVCDTKTYYRENIALIYYVETQTDLQNIPDPDKLIDLLCN
jgi:hypothetical protein